MQEVVVAGERLVLHPEGAAFWPAASTLLVADVHLGKAAAFRSQAIPVPGGTTTATLDRLAGLMSRTGAQRLIVLGDLWHAKEGRAEKTVEAFRAWRERHGEAEIVLVEGNHDRRSGPVPADLRVLEVGEGYEAGPFRLCHYPDACAEQQGGYVLSGHVHPSVRMSGPGKLTQQFVCFWFGEKVAVFPAFGDFTGCALVRPKVGDRVFALVEGAVIAIPTRRTDSIVNEGTLA